MTDIRKQQSSNVRDRFFIRGEWIASRSGRRGAVADPAAETVLVEIPLADAADSRDLERAYVVACRIQTGQVGVNGVELGPTVPFGGRKFSGIGREGRLEGPQAFFETKSGFLPTPSGAPAAGRVSTAPDRIPAYVTAES